MNDVVSQDEQITALTAQAVPEQAFVVPKIEIGGLEAGIGIVTILIGIGMSWGSLKTTMKNVENSLKEQIAPDLKNVRERFVIVEDRVDTLWKDKFAPANSPRQLNERGEDILEKSGIKEIINSKRTFLLELVGQQSPKNAYDAENQIEKIMFDLPKHCPDILDQLKDGAFKTGTEFSAILFIGSIYLRNEIFPELGFSVNDLDKPKV